MAIEQIKSKREAYAQYMCAVHMRHANSCGWQGNSRNNLKFKYVDVK